VTPSSEYDSERKALTARAKYAVGRRRMQAYGRWHPWADAEPVRAHVLALQEAGMGVRTIAAAAGVPASVLSRLLYGEPRRCVLPARQVRPFTAAAVLSVSAALCSRPDGARVDRAGSCRRLQALIAVGWTRRKLAARLGVDQSTVKAIVEGGGVTADTARRVIALYDDLWDALPPLETRWDRGIATSARREAEARGWLPPAAWDDHLIDLPDAELEVELARLVALMETRERRRCAEAVAAGDRSLLVCAAAEEYRRRRYASELRPTG
jgi:plasmid maintenance system antidote protein VapI